MKLSNDLYEEIKETVAKVFENYGIRGVPISSFELAVKMGIPIQPYSAFPEPIQKKMKKESEDGFTVIKDEKWHIFYNDKDHTYGRINNLCMKLDTLFSSIRKTAN